MTNWNRTPVEHAGVEFFGVDKDPGVRTWTENRELPVLASDVTLLCFDREGPLVEIAQSRADKEVLIGREARDAGSSSEWPIVAIWPGRIRSDVFVLDDIVALARELGLVKAPPPEVGTVVRQVTVDGPVDEGKLYRITDSVSTGFVDGWYDSCFAPATPQVGDRVRIVGRIPGLSVGEHLGDLGTVVVGADSGSIYYGVQIDGGRPLLMGPEALELLPDAEAPAYVEPTPKYAVGDEVLAHGYCAHTEPKRRGVVLAVYGHLAGGIHYDVTVDGDPADVRHVMRSEMELEPYVAPVRTPKYAVGDRVLTSGFMARSQPKRPATVLGVGYTDQFAVDYLVQVEGDGRPVTRGEASLEPYVAQAPEHQFKVGDRVRFAITPLTGTVARLGPEDHDLHYFVEWDGSGYPTRMSGKDLEAVTPEVSGIKVGDIVVTHEPWGSRLVNARVVGIHEDMADEGEELELDFGTSGVYCRSRADVYVKAAR